MNRAWSRFAIEAAAVVLSILLFGIPFYYVILNSFKSQSEAASLSIAWPSTFHILDNYKAVLTAQNGMAIRAFLNSAVLTALSVAALVVVCSLAGYVMQRRQGRASSWIDFLTLAGLMIPPSIVPTIWILQKTGLFKTLPGLVLVEVALSFSFSALLYKSFLTTIPREIDESALVDGSGGIRLFLQIIFPLLKPVTATVIVLMSTNIFNDFANPLYFLPGAKNATVQLTLYNFKSMYLTFWNLLFADVVIISLPPLILFLFFNKRIVAGMTAGAIKA